MHCLLELYAWFGERQLYLITFSAFKNNYKNDEIILYPVKRSLTFLKLAKKADIILRILLTTNEYITKWMNKWKIRRSMNK